MITTLQVIQVVVGVFAAVSALLSLFLAASVLLGARGSRLFIQDGPAESDQTQTPVRAVVVIPAHNESAVLAQTLAAALRVLPGEVGVLVVADNCTDDTADIARRAGVQVLERHDDQRRGKGYALAAALTHLRNEAQAPDAVLILDADCTLHCTNGAEDIRGFIHESVRQNRPMQMVYLLEAEGEPTVKQRISLFAFRVKNLVRMAGLRRMGGGCLLGGTGMALPFDLLDPEAIATGETVEDMRLAIDLALSGKSPGFSTRCMVTAPDAPNERALQTQRTRWEQGHLRMIASYSLPLFRRGLGSRKLLLMALDLSVPPLSLHLMLTVGVWLCAAAVLGVGLALGSVPVGVVGLSLASVSLIAFMLAIAAAYWSVGRDLLRPRDTLFFVGYALSKMGIYWRTATNQETAWVRTERAVREE